MKITVAKSDLEPVIATASAGLASSSGDITGHLVIRPAGDGAEVMSYNGRIGASATLPAKIDSKEEARPFTIEGWRLKQWISAAGDVDLTITEKDGKVTVKSPKSRGTFRSLDPENFSFWDEQLNEATKVATMPASQVKDALNAVKNFVYSKDTQNPEYAVCQARNGTVQSSDRLSMSVYISEALGEAEFRIHGKDIAPVVAFLQSAGDEEVELLEQEHALFIRRPGGEVLVVGRPNTALPKIRYHTSEDNPFTWDLPKDELSAAIQQLVATAEQSNSSLKFLYDPAKQRVILSMRSAEGTYDQVPIECKDTAENTELFAGNLREALAGKFRKKLKELSEEDGEKLLADETEKLMNEAREIYEKQGFALSYKHLKVVLSNIEGDVVRFGVTPLGKGGFVRFFHTRENDDKHLVVLAWVRDIQK